MRVDEVVFKFARHHWRQSIRGEAVQHPAQDVPRIDVVWGSVKLIKGCQHLRHIVSKPRRTHQRPRRGLGEPVRIAIFPDQPGILAILACDVTYEDRSRQEATIFIDGHQLVPAQTFSARHAGQRREYYFNKFNFGVRGQESTRFLGIGYQG